METRSFRDRSAVGRFPSVTLDFGEDTEDDKEELEEDDLQTENACRRWLLKICPCCRPKPDDGDSTDTVVTVGGENDKEDEEEKDKDEEKPGDNELNGNLGLASN